ncbi:MAG: GMC oxidoreductase [Dongiaceae bacterium]
MFRDRSVGRVTSNGFEYALAEEDHPGWLDSLRTGARIMFAAGARRVFFNSNHPLIVNGPEEIDAALTLDLVSQQRIQITSGHPMGGCALGGDPKRDVVDSATACRTIGIRNFSGSSRKSTPKFRPASIRI